jgi:hypothetical protein
LYRDLAGNEGVPAFL